MPHGLPFYVAYPWPDKLYLLSKFVECSPPKISNIQIY